MNTLCLFSENTREAVSPSSILAFRFQFGPFRVVLICLDVMVEAEAHSVEVYNTTYAFCEAAIGLDYEEHWTYQKNLVCDITRQVIQ
jgi:hypothetical protein